MAALRRAVRLGDGWIGSEHTPHSLAPQLARLRALEESSGRSVPLTVTVGAGPVTGRQDVAELMAADVDAFADSGVDRLIVRPWRRRREAVASLERFARDHAVSNG